MLQTLSAAESKRAVPYADDAVWFNTVRASGGKIGEAMQRTGLQTLQPRDGLKRTPCVSVSFLTFHNLEFKQKNLPSGFESRSEYFNFCKCNFKINMKKKSVNFFQGIGLSQLFLTLAEKAQTKNLDCATPVSSRCIVLCQGPGG